MKNRAADAAIRGYIYQFHKSIIETLSLNDVGRLTIEGIEDVDISSVDETQLIQCKYFEAQNYAKSKLREAICEMLLHFKKNGGSTQYYVYAHFKNRDEAVVRWSEDELRQITIFTSNKKKIDFCKLNGISSLNLKAFSKTHSIIFGPSLETQEQQIVELLREALGCNEDLAQALYYPKAIAAISKIACQKSLSKRTISKSDFIKLIDKTTDIFNALYLRHRGITKYVKECQARLRMNKSLTRGYEVIVFLGSNISQGFTPEKIAGLINDVCKFQFKFYDSKPWTFCLSNFDSTKMHSLKRELFKKGVKFNDGGEPYHLSTDLFKEPPLIERTSEGKGNNIKRSSFQARIISENGLNIPDLRNQKYDTAISCDGSNYEHRTTNTSHYYKFSNIDCGTLLQILIGA